MSALNTDTRSIGQVLFEKLMPRRYEWRLLGDTDREKYERAAEIIFKRGHDARGKEERALSPKTKQYRDALADAVNALREVRAQSLCAIGQDSWPEMQERLLSFADDARAAITKAEAVLK